MTCLVSKGRTSVGSPWLAKVWIRLNKAAYVVPAHKLLFPRFSFECCKLIKCDKAVVICIATNINQPSALHEFKLSVSQCSSSSQDNCFTINVIISLQVFNYAQISSWSASERLVNWAVNRRAPSSSDEDNSPVLVDGHRARAPTACPQWERGTVVSSWWEERELVEVSRGGF